MHTCSSAASGGHLSILPWAPANGSPWNKNTCAYVAREGYFDVLKWAIENGCPCDEQTCGYLLEDNQEMFQWAREHGAP